MTTSPVPRRGQIAQRFEYYGVHECAGMSALYERLSLAIAGDEELCALCEGIRAGQPVPNLLFASVHFLLLSGLDNGLGAYFASVGEGRPADDALAPLFKAFCMQNEAALLELVATRLVQTSQVSRCALLLPAFYLAAQRSGLPLALLEIGPSAGLNLLWDRYRYRYSNGAACGPEQSPLTLFTELRGPHVPPLPAVLPSIAWRLGLDLNPIDVFDEDATRWLEALTWPDEAGRMAALRLALAIARDDPPELVRGDALQTLPGALARVPADTCLCVFHSAAVNQFSPEGRARLSALLREEGRRRPVTRISMEAIGGSPRPRIDFTVYDGGSEEERQLAWCEAHGSWLEWLVPS